MDSLSENVVYIIEGTLKDEILLEENTLNAKIKYLRLKKGLSLKELAQICELNAMTLSYIENHVKMPYMSTLRRIAVALDTTVSYLLDAKNMPEETNGQRIKKYRIIKELSVKELSELVNIARPTLQDYEAGRLNNPDTIERIMNILKMD